MDVKILIYFNIMICALFGKFYDDIVDIQYLKKKFHNEKLKLRLRLIIGITALLVFLFIIITNNIYLIFFFIYIVTIPILICPKGYRDEIPDRDYTKISIILTLISLGFIVVYFKQINFKYLLVMTSIVPLTYIFFINEESTYTSKFLPIKDKEVSKYKIITRSFAIFFWSFLVLYLNKKIFNFFDIYDEKPLIAINMYIIYWIFNLIVSVVLQTYCLINGVEEFT